MKILLVGLFTFLMFKGFSQNVGIGTNTPTKAGLVVNTKVGAVHAMFGDNTSGVSIESNYPGISFNGYYNGGHKAIVTGYISGMEMEPTSGSLTFYSTPTSTAANAIGIISTNLTINKDGNIGIGGNPINTQKLFVNGSQRINGTLYLFQDNSGQNLTVQRSETETTATPIINLINGFIGVNQTASKRTAFEHVTSASTISGNSSKLIYPGASSSDMVFITHKVTGAYVNTAFSVYYDPFESNWKIVTQSVVNMPADLRFNVMVIKPTN